MRYLKIVVLFFAFFLFSCDNQKSSQKKSTGQGTLISQVKHPHWAENANIYEVNIRQYTPEGTFAAFEKHLPRLKKMGVDILWLMPIHPIGEINRKGSLGSYYSVKDYFAVNPEYGSIDDLQRLVEKSHELGMYVIIDWVANHTAWDNSWVKEHPEWYVRDSSGKMYSPFNWTDVVQLDYNNPELRKEMIRALKFWVSKAGIDGYRCDVAGMVPTDFWVEARKELEKIKPVFMLAEAEKPELLLNAFDADYSWHLLHLTNEIAKGKANANNLGNYFIQLDTILPKGAFKMNFTTNHDENSWNGTVFERYGDGAKTFAVLISTIPGMPLIYTGQEAAINKRLSFFEKDQVEWKNLEYFNFYKTLLQLKNRNKALWNGNSGGQLKRIKSTADKSVFAFIREKDNHKIFVLLNLSSEKQNFKLSGNDFTGRYCDVFNEGEIIFVKDHEWQLLPWEYFVFEK